MDVRPLPKIPGLPKYDILRLDDDSERYAVELALSAVGEPVDPHDDRLLAHLGKIANRSFPRRVFVNVPQLGRIVSGLDAMLAATQRLEDVDAEIDVLTMVEIIRPYST